MSEWKIKISDEAQSDLDKIPEEDAQMILDELAKLVESGELLDASTPLTLEELRVVSPEAYERLTGEKIVGN